MKALAAAVLFAGSAGFTRATATVVADDGRSFSDTQKLYGAALGGGVDARLTKALSVRLLEYLFFKFAKQSFFKTPSSTCCASG